MSKKVDVVELAERDLTDLAPFYRGQIADQEGRTETGRMTAERLRWFLFENPARSDEIPSGWAMRDSAGGIVGGMLCVPQRFCVRDRTLVLCMGGSYYVSKEYRGLGMALFQRYRKLSQGHALFCTTANEQSGTVWTRFGGYPIPNCDHEFVGVLHTQPLVEEWLMRRFGNSQIARMGALPSALAPSAFAFRSRKLARGSELVQIETPAAVPDMDTLAPPDHASQVTAVRDQAFLSWRYFQYPDAACSLFRFQSETGADCLVAVQIEPRGHRQHIRTLTVLDVWGRLPGDAAGALAARLALRFAQDVDVIVFRGQGRDRQQAFQRAGLLRRELPLAIAWCIDPQEHLRTRDWYLTPADGDMAI